MIDEFLGRVELSAYSLEQLNWKNTYKTKNKDSLRAIYGIPSRTGNNDVEMYLTISEVSNYVIIKGNLRKWWLGDNAFSDLSCKDFIESLGYLANVLDADLSELIKLELTKIGIGLNVRLHRKYASIIPSMKRFPRLKERVSYLDQTVKFVGSKKTVKCYDKLRETASRVFKSKNLKKKRNKVDKILKNNFSLRFEISGNPIAFTGVKNDVKSFESIQEGWNKIVDYVVDEFHKIEIADDFQNLDYDRLENLNFTEIKDVFSFLIIEKISLEDTYGFIDRYGGRHKSEYKPKFKEIYDRYYLKEMIDTKTVVSNELVKKASRLKDLDSILIR